MAFSKFGLKIDEGLLIKFDGLVKFINLLEETNNSSESCREKGVAAFCHADEGSENVFVDKLSLLNLKHLEPAGSKTHSCFNNLRVVFNGKFFHFCACLE